MSTPSPWRHFVGQNIKGTPAMSGLKVAHDLGVVKKHADVFVAQEFKWAWYWQTLGRVLPKAKGSDWRTYPTLGKGVAHPIMGGQPIGWKHEIFTRVDSQQLLLHNGHAGISDDRWLRGVLLRDRAVGLECWFASTHFVVGGDRPSDGPIRKAMLAGDLQHLHQFLAALVSTGDPIVFELDANIHPGTQAYVELVSIVRNFGGTFHGNMGVEYLFTIDGKDGVKVDAGPAWTIPNSQLYTDHEGRGLTFRLVAG